MSQWANEHPEEMAEIAALPLNQQNAALRAAIGYDPDAIRDQLEEEASAGSVPAVNPPSGSAGPAVDPRECDVCGAWRDEPHQPWCDLGGKR